MSERTPIRSKIRNNVKDMPRPVKLAVGLTLGGVALNTLGACGGGVNPGAVESPVTPTDRPNPTETPRPTDAPTPSSQEAMTVALNELMPEAAIYELASLESDDLSSTEALSDVINTAHRAYEEGIQQYGGLEAIGSGDLIDSTEEITATDDVIRIWVTGFDTNTDTRISLVQVIETQPTLQEGGASETGVQQVSALITPTMEITSSGVLSQTEETDSVTVSAALMMYRYHKDELFQASWIPTEDGKGYQPAWKKVPTAEGEQAEFVALDTDGKEVIKKLPEGVDVQLPVIWGEKDTNQEPGIIPFTEPQIIELGGHTAEFNIAYYDSGDELNARQTLDDRNIEAIVFNSNNSELLSDLKNNVESSMWLTYVIQQIPNLGDYLVGSGQDITFDLERAINDVGVTKEEFTSNPEAYAIKLWTDQSADDQKPEEITLAQVNTVNHVATMEVNGKGQVTDTSGRSKRYSWNPETGTLSYYAILGASSYDKALKNNYPNAQPGTPEWAALGMGALGMQAPFELMALSVEEGSGNSQLNATQLAAIEQALRYRYADEVHQMRQGASWFLGDGNSPDELLADELGIGSQGQINTLSDEEYDKKFNAISVRTSPLTLKFK